MNTNPLYSYTIADPSFIYNDLSVTVPEKYTKFTKYAPENPSLPMCNIIQRLYKAKSVLAIVSQQNTPSLVTQVNNYEHYIKTFCTYAIFNHTNSVFPIVKYTTESEMNDFIKSTKYDDKNVKKIAFAIVFNSVDVSSGQWDYSIRTNYTSSNDEKWKTVACLYSGELFLCLLCCVVMGRVVLCCCV